MTRDEFNEVLTKELAFVKERCYPTDEYSIFEPAFIQSMSWLYDNFQYSTCSNCENYTHFGECKLLSYPFIAKYSGDEETILIETEPNFGCNKFKRRLT